MKKWRVAIIALLFILGIGGISFLNLHKILSIKDYDQCQEAGFEIIKTDQLRCRLPNGVFFVKKSKDILKNEDIEVLSPYINQKIMSPLVVKGKAKGGWFFEGQIIGELVDANNNLIVTIPLSAKGNWMTEDFVDFEGELVFSEQKTKNGYLYIKNDNPSGLSQNDKKVIIPVNF